ncbi:MAG: thioredoxin domain-containing protein [Actinomycetales bacterium]|nr:thioredoxin domain-containing protein [Actinomycetales bacterium]
MTEGPQQAQPTTVVGYPQAAPPPTATANPGMASLRSQVRLVRYLVIACLAVLVLLTATLGVALSTTRSQLDDLSAQVSALGQQPAAQPQAAQPQESLPQESAPAQPQTAGVAQLPAAPDLPQGTVIPTGADTGGAMLLGDPAAANVVEVYVDFQCPFCQRWESQIGSALVDRALQPGSDLLVKQYDLAFLGETSQSLSPAGASARAANAAACVLEADGPETFAAFSRLLFQTADPSEPPGQFPTKQLVDLAQQAGASDTVGACIKDETHVPFVAATTLTGFSRGVGGTPTVVLNGRTVENPFTDAELLALGGQS